MAELIFTLSDVSTMWLVCLSFIACLIPLAIAGGMVFGMYKLRGALSPILRQGQEGMTKIADGADKASKKVAAPFVATSAFSSQVRGSLRSLLKVSRRKE